jgi:tRNA 2-thiouridine synthesizing protein A
MPGYPPVPGGHFRNKRGASLTGSKAGLRAGRIICAQASGDARMRGVVRRRGAGAKSTMEEASTVDFDKELDARGLSCPLPILKTKKSLNELTSGQVLKVIATDPGSVKDMQAFANQTGNPLLSTSEEDKTYVFFLKKK